MKHLFQILKGAAIGVANVIPGFSGGTMAVIVGSYDVFVETLGNIFSHPIKALKLGWSLLLGVLLGIILALVAVVKLLEVFPIPTIFFFVGIAVGTLPSTYKNLKGDGKPKLSAVLTFILTAGIIVMLPILNPTTEREITLSLSTMLVLILMGVVCASAMVLPGVSGSLILMLFGYYAFVMSAIKNSLTSVLTLDFALLKTNILVVVFFAVGALVGLVGCAKLVSLLLKKFPVQTRYAVGGLLTVSPIVLIISMVKSYGDVFPSLGVWSLVFSVLAFAIGMALLLWYTSYSDKVEKKTIEG